MVVRPSFGTSSTFIENKFAKKPAIYEANAKVMRDGYNYGNNIHASVSTYRVESAQVKPGIYTDVNGNTATAWGLIAASEKSGLPLFLGSYPITPATDILHELAKRKDLGVKAIQVEDEIAGVCTAIGASFAGNLAVTSTSGPGLALKSEGIGLAVMAELPLVIIDVQRGGPSTGLPTKTEQTDLLQALYGRNGESPVVVVAASTPTDCFDMAFQAAKIALEHMTPVILLTDGFIGNGSSAWRIPEIDEYPEIKPNYVMPEQQGTWKPYDRNEKPYVIGRNLEQRVSCTGSEDWKRIIRLAQFLLTLLTMKDGSCPAAENRRYSHRYSFVEGVGRFFCRFIGCRLGRNLRTFVFCRGSYECRRETCGFRSFQLYQSVAREYRGDITAI